MPEPVAWSYMDERRTHHVQTGLHRGRTLEFVITERDPSSPDESEVYVERHPLLDGWEARAHQMELEARLAQLGSYQRSAGLSWTPLRVPPTRRDVDLTPLTLDAPRGAVQFHHYQERGGKHAVTLVSVEEEMARGKRSFLARLDYSYPDVEGGNLQVLHPRLPPSILRSVLAAQHIELDQMHFEKVTDGRGLGPRSWRALQSVLDALLDRLAEGRLGKDASGPDVGRGSDRDVIAMLEAMVVLRRSRNAASATDHRYETEDELGPLNASVEGKKPEVRMEELPDDIVVAMNEPRLLALHSRFLLPGEDARLIDDGELAILRAMRNKRNTVPPTDRHLVSLLEASLLLRRALTKRTSVDKEVIDRVRHARAYL